MHARETAARAPKKETTPLVASTNATASQTKTSSYGTDGHGDNVEKGYSAELQELLEKESRVPWKRIAQLSALFLVVIIINLVEGSGQVLCGSVGFIGLQVTNVVAIILFAIYFQRDVVDETLAKKALSYEFVDGDVVWDHDHTWKYATVCFIAGICAGLFGIGKCNAVCSRVAHHFLGNGSHDRLSPILSPFVLGGGMIFAPLMLEMGT